MELKKIFNPYEVKTITTVVKDIDPQTRRVKVMLSHFDNVDSDRDVIRMGAFSKSIAERGPDGSNNRRIAFLRHHDWEHAIGTFQTLEETHEGLVAVADLGRSTKANDALLDYQDEIIKEHSIGFNYIEDKMDLVGHGDEQFFEIKELFLWEGSAVTFGSNSLTPTLEVSKGDHIAQIDKVNKEMTSLIGALKNGKGTDERLYSFEMRLKVVQTKYNSLINLVPNVSHENEQPDSSAEAHQKQKSFYKALL